MCAIFVARNRLAILDKSGQVSKEVWFGGLIMSIIDELRRISKSETYQTILLRLSNARFRQTRYFTEALPHSSSLHLHQSCFSTFNSRKCSLN